MSLALTVLALGLLSGCSGGGGGSSGSTTPQPTVAISVQPTSLNFSSEIVGQTSAAHPITIKSTGTATLALNKVSVGGTNAAAFTLQQTCGSTLAAGSSCTLSVSFKPTGPGAASASIAIATNAAGSPSSVTLGGTGAIAQPTAAACANATTAGSGGATSGRQWVWQAGASALGAGGVYGQQGAAAAANAPGARSLSASGRVASSGALLLFGGFGCDAQRQQGFLNDLWSYSPTSGQWTWLGGSTAVGAKGIYGSGATATPGARYGSAAWIDAAGNLWVFGGIGYDSEGTRDLLNDLWTFSATTSQWTFVSGSSTVRGAANYGTQGAPSATAVPGARNQAISWFANSQLWLFGGFGLDKSGHRGALNDLWSFKPATGQWTWVGGATSVNGQGVYGSLGAAAASNWPGARDWSATWADSSANLWLFGGNGYDANGAESILNDLWRYNPTAGQWTWMGGSNVVDVAGTYGTQGSPSTMTVPGARDGAVAGIDSSGTFWLFGGFSFDGTGKLGRLNDLWSYSPTTGRWTWVGGASVAASGASYGSLGKSATTNLPGARAAAVGWIDGGGNLWLFGGSSSDSAGNPGVLNDLWEALP